MLDVPPVAVIEDDDAVREAMSALLEVLGFRVRLCSSAEQFLLAGAGERFSCIITDLRLPGLDGLELHAELRARGQLSPVILVTSHISRQSAAKAMLAGVRAVLLKPVSATALVTELKAIIGENNHTKGKPGDTLR